MAGQKAKFEKQQAEGSRDVVERELQRQEDRKANKVDHLPGVKVSGQPQGGAAAPDDENERQK